MIYQKLLEIQKATRSLAPNTTGQTGMAKYQYVSGAKLLGVVRPLMDQVGVILSQEIVSIENSPINYNTTKGAKMEMFTTIKLRFTWIDCEDGSSFSTEFAANGMNAFDKGLGSALTYAERYFLMKFFHISTDEDDIDALVKDEAVSVAPVSADNGPELQPAENTNSVEYAIRLAQNARSSQELRKVWNDYKEMFGRDINFVRTIQTSPYNDAKGRSTNKS